MDTEGKELADIYCELIDKDAYYNSAWSKIIRRSLLMDNNIRFEEGIVGEDNEWYYHVVMVAKKLVLLDEPLYVYRRRSGSTTTTATEKNLRDQFHVLDKWEKILLTSEKDGRAKVVWGSLAKQFCSADIPGRTKIHPSVSFAHGRLGVVINPASEIGADCIINTKVTLGNGYPHGGAPKLGKGVYVGAGAFIGGDCLKTHSSQNVS